MPPVRIQYSERNNSGFGTALKTKTSKIVITAAVPTGALFQEARQAYGTLMQTIRYNQTAAMKMYNTDHKTV